MFDLTGKVALVVGGAGYLGGPVCRGLAAQGANVVIGDIACEAAKVLAEEIGAADPKVKARAMDMDIGCEESVKKVIDEIGTEFGKLDILVNCAYWSSRSKKTLEELAADEFDKAKKRLLGP